MRFKKVYIEITNVCNLNCSFCTKKNRKIKYLSFDEFKIIIDKLNGQTKYLYFHILGEPLLHPLINDFINYASSQGFFINLTTNGYLIKKIIDNPNIRQINISLHSYDEKYVLKLEEYMQNIFEAIDNLDNNTYFNLRFWVKNKVHEEMLKLIKKRYTVDENTLKIKDNVYLSYFHEFTWPDLDNNYYNECGKCYGLINHIGILSDGTVIPCCLDTNGIINLGNIFDRDLNDILQDERVIKMIDGFKKNKKVEELCRKCQFL